MQGTITDAALEGLQFKGGGTEIKEYEVIERDLEDGIVDILDALFDRRGEGYKHDA